MFEPWLWIITSTVAHEFGHVAACWACGVEVKKAGISRKGVYIVRAASTPTKNACISLAGPMTNLLLAMLLTGIGAEVNLLLALINLLPFWHTDGARAWQQLGIGRHEKGGVHA